MTYAIIEIGGKQIKATVNEPIWVEKIDQEAGEEITIDKVLAVYANDKLTIGKPLVENAKVIGEIEKQGKAKKITILRTKQKSNWKRKQGHRQPYTRIMIKEIKV